jgi:uncharacterized protein YhaN
MRFERLTIPAFGALRDLDTGDEALGSLVVVHGPNESGKSTFFEAVTSVLYGLSPASRDRHPLTPWSGAEGEIVARLITDDGITLAVHRRLLKNATGKVTTGGEERAIRNRPLEAVEFVSRELFRQVFALTLAELAALSSASWDQLQERLLSHMGAQDIVAARTAAEKLEEDAARLWRPNRRGSQRVQELKDAIHERMEARREADANDRRIRELTGEVAQLEAELQRLRRDREHQRLVVDRATVLLPLQRRLRSLQALKVQADTGPSLDDVPDGLGERVGRLAEEAGALANRHRDLLSESEAPQELVERFTPQLQLALESRREIMDAGAVAAQAESTATHNARLTQDVHDLDRRIASAARELFTGALDEDSTRRVAELALGDLSERMDQWLEARRRAEEAARAREVSAAATPAPWESVAGVIALVMAALLFFFGPSSGTGGPGDTDGGSVAVGLGGLSAPLGGMLLAVGAVLLWRWFEGRRRAAADEVGEGADSSTEAARDRALARVKEALKGLPLRERELDRAFVTELRRLQELGEDRSARQASLDGGLAQIEAASRTVSDLGARLGVSLPAHAGAAAHQLEGHLTSAERAEVAAQGATRDLARINAELATVNVRRAEVKEEQAALVELLARFGNGDPVAGQTHLAARQQAAEDARRLEAELRHEHPALEELEARIARAEEAGEPWLEDDDSLATARAEVQNLSARIEETVAAAEGLTTELAHKADGITSDQIDGEVEALREALAEAKRDRDRMIVLAQIIRRADRDFRERNDPDVIDGASAHLSAITRGRYHELIAPEADPSASLRVVDPDSGDEVSVENLSTGAQEQIYFSLRMSIMDRLDSEGERLPVLVDEAFVNWDSERRSRVLNVLHRLGETRQVFVFTCHDEWAEELRARGGRLISLDEEAR